MEFLSKNLNQRRRTFKDTEGMVWEWSDMFIDEKVDYYKNRKQLTWLVYNTFSY